MNNTEFIIKQIKRALMSCADPTADENYKLGYCKATLQSILQDLELNQEEQPEQDLDPWGVLGALDEATKIR